MPATWPDCACAGVETGTTQDSVTAGATDDPPGDRRFMNSEVAFKYKMSALQAALGLAQLERIDELTHESVRSSPGIATRSRVCPAWSSITSQTEYFELAQRLIINVRLK